MATAIVYLRVSTQRQGKSGLGLDAQRSAVAEYTRAHGLEVAGEFVEVESGKKADRPQLRAALAASQRLGAKLLVAKIDRLARSVAFVSNLMEANVDFVACDMPEANRLTIHIIAAVAEHERTMISARTKAALAAAKARGVKLGGIRGQSHLKAAAVRSAKSRERAQTTLAVIEQIKRGGIVSFRGIANELVARGIKTSRGKSHWYPASVRQVLSWAA